MVGLAGLEPATPTLKCRALPAELQSVVVEKVVVYQILRFSTIAVREGRYSLTCCTSSL